MHLRFKNNGVCGRNFTQLEVRYPAEEDNAPGVVAIWVTNPEARDFHHGSVILTPEQLRTLVEQLNRILAKYPEAQPDVEVVEDRV